MTQDSPIETVAWAMVQAGLPIDFVRRVLELAAGNEGVRELLYIWDESDEPADRDASVVALSDAIEDHEQPSPPLRIRSEADVELLIATRKTWKEHLRALIEANGGVSRVAREAGIPLPSLSRLLNALHEPRPATLRRLADALGLPVEALHPSSEEAGGVVVHLADYRPAAPEPPGPRLTYRTAHG